ARPTAVPAPAPPHERSPGTHPHGSAFGAAAADRWGIYLLPPPEHGQNLLANAQGAWLADARGAKSGWRPVSPREAQAEANRGNLVVVVYINPDPQESGHSAIVRPSLKGEASFETDGPDIIMAGQVHPPRTAARLGFRYRGAYPNGIHYYAHDLRL